MALLTAAAPPNVLWWRLESFFSSISASVRTNRLNKPGFLPFRGIFFPIGNFAISVVICHFPRKLQFVIQLLLQAFSAPSRGTVRWLMSASYGGGALLFWGVRGRRSIFSDGARQRVSLGRNPPCAEENCSDALSCNFKQSICHHFQGMCNYLCNDMLKFGSCLLVSSFPWIPVQYSQAEATEITQICDGLHPVFLITSLLMIRS